MESSSTRSYDVVDQAQLPAFTQQGDRSYDWAITIQTRNGTQAQFTVPESAYTAENVHAIATMLANEIDRVANLPRSIGQ